MNCQNSKCKEQLSYNTIITGTVISCDNCENVFYCSLTCRDFDWQGQHKSICNGVYDPVPRLTQSQLNENLKLLGEGSFGQVYLKQLNGYNFAIKKINKSIGYRELKIHKQLRHKHIIQLFQFMEKEDELFLILEYAKNGHLTSKLSLDPTLIISQLCQALQYLHSLNIIHRDIKPGNVLIDHKNNVKLCDFGLATHIDIISNFSGTYEFMAPEIIKNFPQSYSVDVWSLGCLLYWLLEGKPIVHGNDAEMIEQILTFTEPQFSINDQYAKELITKMLNPNPESRITLNEIIRHPYITKEYLIKLKVEESSNSFSDETQASYHPQPSIHYGKNNFEDKNVFQKFVSLFTCMARDK